MMKFLKGLMIWQIMRTNLDIVKKCMISGGIIFISLYFFSDWEHYFEMKNNLDMLFYLKLTKYLVLICTGIFISSNLKKISIIRKNEKGPPASLQQKAIDTDLERLLEKPDLLTKTNKIKTKYSLKKLNA